MTYWRMQIHPDEAESAIRHSVECLSAGYIGLDFQVDVPDMLTVTTDALPPNKRDFALFATEMQVDDRVLVFAHHFPLALVRVAGPYNYMRELEPALRVWFRHLRRIDDVRYFGDRVTNVRDWMPLTMTATITPLRDPSSASFQLIDDWLAS